MELKIEPTSSTPAVYFNNETNVLVIEGRSLSENPTEYTEIISKWLEENFFSNKNDELIFVIKLEYYNSSSFNNILKLLNDIEKYYKLGKKAKILWYSHKDDEVEKEDVEEIKNQFKIPIEILYF